MTSHIISLRLNSEQTVLVASLLAKQRDGKSTAILSLVSSSYEPEMGQSTVKLDVAWLDRKLAQKIQAIQTEIGATNKEIRERKAERQTNGNGSKQPPQQKTRPFAADLEFETYFRLAAHNELAPALYAQIERCAKSMIADARRMGLE